MKFAEAVSPSGGWVSHARTPTSRMTDQGRTSMAAHETHQIWPDDPIEMVRALYPPLLATAAALAPASEAEDLVQTTLTQMLVRYPQFRGIDHPLGLGRTILYRLVYKARRSRMPIEGVLELLEDERPGPEAVVTQRLLVGEGLGRLGTKQRLCLWLLVVEGLSDEQVGAILGCRPSTVRSQAARAKHSLREWLSKSESGEK